MSAIYRLISAAELDAPLLARWRAIQAGNPAFQSPYFCPEFTQQVAGVRDDVRVVVIENGGRAVGFLPYQRNAWGGGRPVGGRLSDYHGVVTAEGAEWRLDELMRAAKLSVWEFDHLVGDTREFRAHAWRRDCSPQIDLSEGYERYMQKRREAGTRQIVQAERLARKLRRDVGELQFTMHDASPAVLDTLMQWKRDQYRRSGAADVFAVSWTGELLRRLAHAQTREFAGVCSVLRVGNRVLAAHMGMRSRDMLHYWFPAYDRAFAKYSAGIILVLRLAQAAAGQGVRTIDFGRGDEPYKQRLMTHSVELLEGAVEQPSLVSMARRLQRRAETCAARGGLGAVLKLPLRLVRSIQRRRTLS